MQGGHSTYIWKLENFSVANAQQHVSCNQCILKYADDQAKGIDFTFPPDRMKWEARALESDVVRQACTLEPSIRVPHALHATDRALAVAWGGDIDLRSAILTNALQDEGAISARLGKWLAHLHKAGLDNSSVRSWSNGMVNVILKQEEPCMRKLLADNGFAPDAIDRASKLFSKPTGVQTGIMFDFRPMNVLLSNVEASVPDVAVIDMECSTYGDPALDFHFWLGEALIIESQSKRKGLVSSFLDSYAREAGSVLLTKELVCKVAVLIGAVWSFTSFSVWDAKAEAELWRRLAVEYIRAGIEEDFAWLAQSDLQPLLAHISA
jgi:hypothetical protein